METEASKFETSEISADFLASTPLLLESWKLCNLTYSNPTVPGSFVIDQVGEVGYVGFSAVQNVTELNLIGNQLVQIDSGVFLNLKGDDEVPPMVHAGFLHLFISVYSNSPEFQNKMLGLMEKCKALLFTGHGIGGAIATLAALWLKSHSSNHSVICFTFGSPLLGNESLAKAILREKWGGNFFNVVSKHDIVPRLLFSEFSPLTFVTGQLNGLLQLWVLAMTSQQLGHLASQLSDNIEMHAFHQRLSGHLAATATAQDNTMRSPYSPFGNYVFCSNEGAICLDNISAVVKMLHLLFIDSTVNSSITDHLSYGEVVTRVSHQFLKRRGFTQGVNMSDSSSDMGIASALGALGLPNLPQVQDLFTQQAWECLKKARQTGFTPNRNSVDLSRKLGKITPNRAQIEWYKASCDDSDDQMGYYDSFKLIRPSKKDSHVNMNRHKLGSFWNNVIRMVENNELPHDFHKRPKWVNASQFYKLLVEPLDIADYYRSGMHRTKGHYLKHGRERRYEIFDKWWRDRKVADEYKKRTKYAGLTQDSCFWARVEEASEWVKNVMTLNDPQKLAQLWENINQFEQYAMRLVERKEVSKDVVAKNSSYSLWVDELKELKSQFMQSPPRSMFPGHFGGTLLN